MFFELFTGIIEERSRQVKDKAPEAAVKGRQFLE